MRPLGGVILGTYIHRYGRRAGLMLTLGLMAVGTLTVIRGAESDLLPPDLAQKMESRSLFAKVHTIEGCGHAPPLMNSEQIKVVSDFVISDAPQP